MNDSLSLTEIGRIYGVSSHTVGKWLKNLGLRTDARMPSGRAFDEGFVQRRPSTQPGTYFYVWNSDLTTEQLDGMGYPRAIQADATLL